MRGSLSYSGIWCVVLCLLHLSLGKARGDVKKVDVTATTFDSAISDIQWMQPDSQIVMVLTGSGRIWRSSNAGRVFRDLTREISKNTSQDVFFESLIVHPKDNSTAILLSKGVHHYYTDDAGQNWNEFGEKVRLHNFLWHPLRPTYALYSRWTEGCSSVAKARNPNVEDCNHMLFISSDFGKTKMKISNFVVQYNWGSKSDPIRADNIFFTAHNEGRGGQPRHGGWHRTVDFYISKELGKSNQLLLKGGNKFLVSRNYVFVAQIEDFLQQTVNLMVSSDWGERFNKAKIPTTLREKSYTILDTSEGGVLIHVNHGSSSPGLLEGNVYVSDPSGLKYSLSLPNNIRSATGECEFDKVLGLEGIYLANFRDALAPANSSIPGASADKQMDEAQERETQGDALARRHSNKTKKSAPTVRTVISFDKGGYWDYLTAPTVDSLGKSIQCEDPSKCYLHLHGITHFDRFAPFYSIENALGMIMGTGNVGSHLSRDGENVNTYISRDAGRTWHEAHKGAYIYEYGDHGGLVVMANDAAATDQVVFSWNEGHSWYDFDLGMRGISVDNVVIEPTSSGLEFLLYGSLKDKGVLFHLDYATLGQPMCTGPDQPNALSSDYETWIPTDGKGRKCILGKTTKYTRKRVTSECFNGREFERQKTKDLCECTKDDFVCETGFYRKVGQTDGDCEPSTYEDREYMEIKSCTSSGIYWTNAWRKVAGNECTNGWKPEKVPVPCPPSSPMAHGARFTLILILLTGSVVGFIAWASKHPVLRHYIHQTGFDTFMDVGYSVVEKASQSVQKGGEELFNFWSSENTTNNGGGVHRVDILPLGQKPGMDDGRGIAVQPPFYESGPARISNLGSSQMEMNTPQQSRIIGNSMDNGGLNPDSIL